jgi:hypothetical protein
LGWPFDTYSTLHRTVLLAFRAFSERLGAVWFRLRTLSV